MTEATNETDAVLTANLSFYRCFAERDIAGMESVWALEVPVTCIHPGWSPRHGRAAVLDSWRSILSNPDAPIIHCHDEQVTFYGPIATVVCEEGLGTSTLFATNIFMFENGAWRMISHQSSPAIAI
jgi:hypothetical protein